ncbi:hypothetical protein PVNG_06064 [Plasmodium vivax North Korean]|uniref:Uncharacterized protein n=1 Tax=Plasmodium vivax North Korean TaxID=1035514 RepID=A0A0J9WFC9_PLAVI|nr:hypothetical protein PVNG_06064 [Plasmodium vivax North Korean]
MCFSLLNNINKLGKIYFILNIKILNNLYIKHIKYIMMNLETEINNIPEIKFYNSLFHEPKETEIGSEYSQKYTDCHCSDLYKKHIIRFIKNYNSYKNHSIKNSYEKYCNYLIYWLYNEKLHISIINNNVLNNWVQCVSCLLDKLEQEHNNHDKKCYFKNEDFSYAFVKIKIILDDMCTIKGRKNLMENVISNRELCISFNNKIDKYIEDIFDILSSISDNNPWKKEYFKIEENCFKGEIYDLFKKIECPPDETAKVQKQETCHTSEETISKVCTEHMCNNLEQLCEKTCKEKVCNTVECPIKNDRTPTSCGSLEQLYPKLCSKPPQYLEPTSDEPEKSPPKIPYLQVLVTVLSSVVGTIFFFLFLYKVKDI